MCGTPSSSGPLHKLQRGRPEANWAESADAQADPLSFLDPRSPRLRFGFVD